MVRAWSARSRGTRRCRAGCPAVPPCAPSRRPVTRAWVPAAERSGPAQPWVPAETCPQASRAPCPRGAGPAPQRRPAAWHAGPDAGRQAWPPACRGVAMAGGSAAPGRGDRGRRWPWPELRTSVDVGGASLPLGCRRCGEVARPGRWWVACDASSRVPAGPAPACDRDRCRRAAVLPEWGRQESSGCGRPAGACQGRAAHLGAGTGAGRAGRPDVPRSAGGPGRKGARPVPWAVGQHRAGVAGRHPGDAAGRRG